MNKETIELERDANHIYNYGSLIEKYTESLLLDKIVEWSKTDKEQQVAFDEEYGVISCRKKQVYKHILRREQENISKDRFYDFKGFNDANYWYNVSPQKIPFCDLVYYLDIYWQ